MDVLGRCRANEIDQDARLPYSLSYDSVARMLLKKTRGRAAEPQPERASPGGIYSQDSPQPSCCRRASSNTRVRPVTPASC
ncbi:hypothetical protein UPYG_G00231660 [Umbra pygmaea]|uniref:Uncharacterized protein n=1 Tax=Umbra pygmaea TaxID=75934 RepID=A0ABD0WXW6_UMBPY